MPRGCSGDFKTPLIKIMLSLSLYCHVFFSWDVVDVGFPTCFKITIYFFRELNLESKSWSMNPILMGQVDMDNSPTKFTTWARICLVGSSHCYQNQHLLLKKKLGILIHTQKQNSNVHLLKSKHCVLLLISVNK
jgi:hypothetical protein